MSNLISKLRPRSSNRVIQISFFSGILCPIAVLPISCEKSDKSENEIKSEEPRKSRTHDDPPLAGKGSTKDPKKITINQIIMSASVGRPEDQIPTWHNSSINENRLRESVAHLPKVIQDEALQEKIAIYNKQLLELAIENQSLLRSAKVFDYAMVAHVT